MRFDGDDARPLPRASDTDAAVRGSYWLDPDELIELVRLGPLVSIDLVISDADGRILVGLRTNAPARDSWFVPGGRVGKGESLDQAFRRIARQELSLTIHRDETRFLGVFEHFYEDNFEGRPDVGTHYVALAHATTVDNAADIHLDGQHQRVRWLEKDELLSDPRVHRNTKAYAELL